MHLLALLILSLAMQINPGDVSKVFYSKKATCPPGQTSGTNNMLWNPAFAGVTPIDTFDTIHSREGFQTIYESLNLSGHTVVPECNPGGTTACPCISRDVALISYQEYGEVISNLRRRRTYVTAIGMKKFVETDTRGDSLSPGIYRYSGEFRLPVIPAPDINQTYNPQAVHLMIQFWDGRDKFFNADDSTFEGTLYWDLNPWTPDLGKVKIYVSPCDLIETGMLLPIDADWHRFELVVNLKTKSYVSLAIDDQNRTLDSLRLARVFHPDWTEDISLTITTESLAAHPGDNCDNVFSWRTHFKALKFEKWTEQPCLLGDVNLDGTISSDDAKSAFHIYLNGGRIPPVVLYDRGCAMEAADMNCTADGITPGDALYIYEASVNMQQPPLVCNTSTS